MGKKNNKNQILHNLFFQLSAVNILINMIQPLNQLIDTIITGKALGAEALKVYALFLPLNAFFLTLSRVLSRGTQISTSHKVGKGYFEESNSVVSTSIIIGAAFSILLSICCFIFASPLATLLGSGSLKASVSGYIRAYSLGIAPAILLDAIMCLMQIEGRKKIVISATFCILIINALGDLANVFIFHKGVIGMAMATAAANILAFLFLGTFFIIKSQLFKINIRLVKAQSLRHILKNGIPTLAYYGSTVIRTIFMNMLILTLLTKEDLVPLLVFTHFGTFADVFIGGHGDAVLVISGILYGEKDRKSAKTLLKTATISGIIMMLILGLITFSFSEPMARIFINKKDISFLPQSAKALSLAAIYLVPNIITTVTKKYIQGIGNGMYTSATNFIYNVVTVCIASFILVHLIGPDGLYLSYTVCYVVGALVNLIYIIFFSFKRFDDKNQKMITYTIHDMDECITTSEEILKYCKDSNVDSKKSYLISLFTEEIGKNIITHGFNKKHNNSIIVKVIISDDRITLCIKDNCVLFNPVHYYDTMKTDPDNIAGGIGIKMLMKLSKNVTYTTSFKLNNLLIEV